MKKFFLGLANVFQIIAQYMVIVAIFDTRRELREIRKAFKQSAA